MNELYNAAIAGDLNEVARLVQHGANPNGDASILFFNKRESPIRAGGGYQL